MDDAYSDTSDLSSPPASPRAPPGFYPSPPPSQDDECRAEQCQDSRPPAKKRRRVGPKERSTQHLDLSDIDRISHSEQESQIDFLTKTLRGHRKIVVIAGAGISTSAGSKSFGTPMAPPAILPDPQFSNLVIVPDFRSTDGLFKSLQKKHNLKASGKLLFDAAVYQDENLTASFHDMVRSLSEEAAKSKTSPTAFHRMLARLGKENRLTRLYTQNIDGIETSMTPLKTDVPLNIKGPWPATVQLHGSLDIMVCQKCRSLYDFNPDLFNSPEPPECPQCTEKNEARQAAGHRSHGIGKLRPRIVLYNEHNPDEEAITSVMNSDIRSRPDALIVAGTSMKIPGVRRLVKVLCDVIRSRKNGVTMWINNEPPTGKEFENCWDLMVNGSCDQVAQLVGLKEWDDESEEVHEECTADQVERLKREHSCSVVIEAPKEKQKTETGLCTPSSSHDEDGSALPRKKSSKAVLPNPASQGRSIADMLKHTKANEPKSRRNKSAPKKRGKKEEPKNSKITTFSKVTKTGKSTAAEKSSSIKNEEAAKAMDSIPPVDARNNASKPMFPNLWNSKSSIQGFEIPGQNDTRYPGSIPHGMENLLNQPSA